MLGLHGRRLAAGLVTAALCAVTAGSCGGGDVPLPPSSPLELGLRLGVPIKLHAGPGGTDLVTNDGVATFDVHNRTSQPVRVVRIDGADADAGLTVTYLGFTHCLPSCDKTGDWEDPQTQTILQRGVEGQYPIVVPPEDTAKLPVQIVLRLSVTQRAMSKFRTGCLWLHGLKITLSDGRHVELRAYDDLSILGIFAETSPLAAPTSPGPARCPLSSPTPA